MKTLIISILLSLLCSCGYPQKIKGKWTCDKEVMKALQLDFNDIYCTYKFKKDGTFVVKIKGETYTIYRELGSIKIKGKYVVQDGMISSIVTSTGIETEAQMILDDNITEQLSPSFHVISTLRDSYEFQVSFEKKMPDILMNKILLHNYLWDWNKEPITITKKELIIGDKLRCKRE